MKRMRRVPSPRFRLRLAALFVAPLAFLWSCGTPGLAPFPGASEALQMDFVPLPIGALNVAGGNFLLPRTDLSIDTRLGTQSFGATWNSATGAWRWSTDLQYDGTRFVDGGGAVHSVSGIQPGRAIPGTHWRVLDTSRLRTKGGLVHRFGSDGRLEEIHWSGDAFPELRFLYTTSSGARRLVSVKQCTANTSCTAVFDLAYDGSGRIASVTDRAGRVVQYRYDTAGKLAEAQDPVATASGAPGTRYAYSNGQISAVTNGDGERIDLTYGGRRLLGLAQVGEEDPAWAFSYLAPDGSNRYRTDVTDPLGNVSHCYYDDSGRLLEMERPSGDAWTWTWSGARISTATDPRGSTTSLTYSDDDPVQVTLPSGDVLDLSYRPDAENRLAPRRTALETASDSLGTIFQATYDAAGHLSSLTNGAGETRSFTYDGFGELTTATSPSGYTITYGGYGEHGHPTTVSSPFVSSTTTYDAVGNLLHGSPQGPDLGTAPGGVLGRRFDGDRRVEEEMLADQPISGAATASTLRIDRRADGRPLAIHRPYGGDTEFVYDAIGRLVAQRELVDGQWQTTAITRDGLGRPASVLRPNGMEVDRTWNADGQLASISRSRNGSLEGSATYSYAGGLLASIQDTIDGGTESYQRDASGRPTSVRFPSGETLDLRYDLRGRDLQETYWMPGAATPLRTLGFIYDGANRQIGVVDGGTAIVTHTINQGRLTRIDYGNGLSRTFGYDPTSSFIDASQTQDTSGSTLESTQITWTMASGVLIVSLSETLPVMSSSESYVIRPATTPAGDIGGARLFRDPEDDVFTYDALSNVLDRGVYPQFPHLAYNAEHNRLLSIRDSSGNVVHDYAYDAAGFVTKRDGVGISWTADGRFSHLGLAVGVEWDLEGRIVSLQVLGQTTRFLFGGRVEADEAGAPRKLALPEAEIDLTTGGRLYRHFDFRGNVSFVTDSNGSVVQAFDYGGFGVRASYGPVGAQRSFAQGRLLNDIVLMGSRLYDTAAARFLAPDPVYQLVNQYAYAMGNPIQFWDPGGTAEGSTVGMAVGAIVIMASASVGQPLGAAFGAGIIMGAAVPVQNPVTDVMLTGAAAIIARFFPESAGYVTAVMLGYGVGQAIEYAVDKYHGGDPEPVSPRGPMGPEITPLPPGNSPNTAGPHPGAGGGGGGGGSNHGGGGSLPALHLGEGTFAFEGPCTVAAMDGSAPSLAWLWLLGPLQVGLGAWLLRSRRRSRRDPPEG